MSTKKFVYTVVIIIVVFVIGFFSIFSFYQTGGLSLSEIIRRSESSNLSVSSSSNQIQSATIATILIEPKNDEIEIKLPPLIPESVKLKNTFTKDSKFDKPKASLLQNYKLPVLMYHHIDSGATLPKDDTIGRGLRVGPQIFEKQLQYIKSKGYNTINSDDLYAFMEFGVELPKNPILMTFDDGYKDNVEQALPILQKYNMIGDFAIITGVVGTGEYMSWEDHKALIKAGNSISSHTVNHCYLAVNVDSKTGASGPFQDSPVDDTPGQLCSRFNNYKQLNTGQIRGELGQSKNDLEKNLGIKIHFLIYPFGKYNSQVINIAKELGYSMATSVEAQANGSIDLVNEPFQIHRIRMNGQQSGEIAGFLD